MMSIKSKALFFLILALIFIPYALGQVESITVDPIDPQPGDVMSITLQSIANSKVNVTVSYSCVLNPSDDEFIFTLTNFEIPENIMELKVDAEHVELLRVTIIINGVPITQATEGEDGVATFTQSNISPGVYWVQLSGVSTGVEQVYVNLEAKSSISTDEQGVYSLEYNTTGFPPGEISITTDTYIEKVSLRAEANTLTPGNIVIIPKNIPEKIKQDEEYTFTYLISNQGKNNLTDILVLFKVDDEIVHWEEILQLLGNGTFVYRVEWTPIHIGSNSIQVIVDPYDEVLETNEDDNVAQFFINVKENNLYRTITGILLGVIIVFLIIWSHTQSKR